MRQRRSRWRIQWMIPFTFRIMTPQGNPERYGWGVIRNLNDQGAEVTTRFPLFYGDMVQLKFHGPENSIYSNLTGKVVRLEKNGIYQTAGIVFDGEENKNTAKTAVANLLNHDW